MSDQTVTFAVDGKVGRITLDRPPANSYEFEFMRQLGAAVDAAESDGAVRVVVLQSASEKFFSAGTKINYYHTQGPEVSAFSV